MYNVTALFKTMKGNKIMDENTNIPQNDEAFVIPGKKEKKSKMPIIAAILFVVCVALTAAAFFMFRPETRLKREVELNYRDYVSRETVLSGITDENTLDALLKGEYDAQGSLQLDQNNIYDKLNGLGLSFNAVVSADQKKMSGNNSIDYSGITLAAFQTYIDEERSTVYMPTFFNESFTLENKNVVSQVKTLPVIGAYFEDKQDFSLAPFAFSDMVYSSKKFADKSKELAMAEVFAALPSVKCEKNGKVTAADGNSYDSYKVTVPGEKAKSAYISFLKNLRSCAEYTAAKDGNLDFVYAATDKIKEELGDIESAKAQFDKEFDDNIKKAEESEARDIIINITPVNDGITFDTSLVIDDRTLDLNGDYDNRLNKLTLKGHGERKNNKIDFVYEDTAGKSDGGETFGQRSIEMSNGSDTVRISSSSQLDANGALNASVNLGNGKKSVGITFNGKSQSKDGGVDITADSILIEGLEYKASLSGSFKAGTRTSEPQDVNAPEDVKIKDIDLLKAMEIYKEAKGKLEGLKKFSKLF